MALQHRLSDAISIKLDSDEFNNPVIEIEFKFIRYRLIIDDVEKSKKMESLLKFSNQPKQNKIKGEVTMPKFYNAK